MQGALSQAHKETISEKLATLVSPSASSTSRTRKPAWSMIMQESKTPTQLSLLWHSHHGRPAGQIPCRSPFLLGSLRRCLCSMCWLASRSSASMFREELDASWCLSCEAYLSWFGHLMHHLKALTSWLVDAGDRRCTKLPRPCEIVYAVS